MLFNIICKYCGVAKGVDLLGKQWAINNGVPVKMFPANWKLHGNKAGFIRNVEMANYANALIAIWDGESSGTKHMIGIAKKLKLRVFIYLT